MLLLALLLAASPAPKPKLFLEPGTAPARMFPTGTAMAAGYAVPEAGLVGEVEGPGVLVVELHRGAGGAEKWRASARLGAADTALPHKAGERKARAQLEIPAGRHPFALVVAPFAAGDEADFPGAEVSIAPAAARVIEASPVVAPPAPPVATASATTPTVATDSPRLALLLAGGAALSRSGYDPGGTGVVALDYGVTDRVRVGAALGLGLNARAGAATLTGRGVDPAVLVNAWTLPLDARVSWTPWEPRTKAVDLWLGLGYRFALLRADVTGFGATDSRWTSAHGGLAFARAELPAGPGAVAVELRWVESFADLGPVANASGAQQLSGATLLAGYAFIF